MTPEEAAKCGNQRDREAWVLSATPEEICAFLTHAAPESHRFQFAIAVLEIQLSKEAERTAQKLVAGTDALIAETKTLVELTRSLKILTIVLVALGVFEFIKFVLDLVCHH
jgi:hypothetical protein